MKTTFTPWFLVLWCFAALSQPQVKEGDRITSSTKIPSKDGEFRLMEVKDTNTGNVLFTSIGCTKTPTKDAPPPTPAGSYDHCLQIGGIPLGGSGEEIKSRILTIHKLEVNAIAMRSNPIEAIKAASEAAAKAVVNPGQTPSPVKPISRLAEIWKFSEQNQKAINAPFEFGQSTQGTKNILYPIVAGYDDQQNKVIGMSSYMVGTNVDSRIVAMQVTGNPNVMNRQLHFSGISLGAPRQLVIDTLGLPSAVHEVGQTKRKRWDYSPFPFSIELNEGSVYSIRIHNPSPESLRMRFTPLQSISE